MERTADFPILPLLIERWSPRAFDAGHRLSMTEVHTIFEAARWAPSAFNLQPWRFVYALRGEDGWAGILAALIPFNQAWAQNASALLCVCSENDAPTKGGGRSPSYSHSFDAGAAWAYMALQAAAIGLHTHAMTGFDPDAASQAIGAPANIRVEAVVAVGRRGDAASLPEGLREREGPSGRHSRADLVFRGRFPASSS